MGFWFVVVVLLLLVYHYRPRRLPARYPPGHFHNVDYKKININDYLPPHTGHRYAIIGTGFLGTTLLSQLLARGEKNIKTFDLFPCKDYLQDERVHMVTGNVLAKDKLKEFLKDVDVVFCTFAAIKFFQRLEHQLKFSYDINVIGTQNVIEACKESGVKYLIQTSTSNVIVGFDKTKISMDENESYATQPFGHYGRTKILAEKAVLEANNSPLKGKSGLLQTGSIRPCSAVFGFGDHISAGRIIRGTVPTMLLDQLYDYVYVENVALAHLLLEEKMFKIPEKVCGQTFCVSNGEPITRVEWYYLWKYFYPKAEFIVLPPGTMTALAYFSEFVQKIGKGKWSLGELDQLTPPTLHLSNQSNTFPSNKAALLLGYKPVFSVVEAIQKTVDLYTNSKK